MTTRFVDQSTYATRALQAYLILISRASHEQRTRYTRLAELMNYGVGGNLGPVLAPIMRWCHKRGFPALTVLVYGESGMPGPGLTTVPGNNYATEIEAVLAFKWFDVFPPTLQELAELSGPQSA